MYNYKHNQLIHVSSSLTLTRPAVTLIQSRFHGCMVASLNTFDFGIIPQTNCYKDANGVEKNTLLTTRVTIPALYIDL